MKEDVLEAEIEPMPAPPDVFMSELAKVRIRMRPIKIESKFQAPQRLRKKKSLCKPFAIHSPLKHPGKRKLSSEEGSSLAGGEINNEATARARRKSRALQFSA